MKQIFLSLTWICFILEFAFILFAFRFLFFSNTDKKYSKYYRRSVYFLMFAAYFVGVIIAVYKGAGFKEIVVNKNMLLQSLYIFPYKLGGFTVCSLSKVIYNLMMDRQMNASLYIGYIYIFLTAIQIGFISLFISNRYRYKKRVLDPVIVSMFVIYLTNCFWGI